MSARPVGGMTDCPTLRECSRTFAVIVAATRALRFGSGIRCPVPCQWAPSAHVLRLFALRRQPGGAGAWRIAKTDGLVLAGSIPLLGIIVEQVQTRELKSRFNL